MSNTRRTRCVGALAVVVGIGAAAVTHPGIAFADPTADPSADASQVESPGTGVPDSKTELEVVSSGGSTPPAGAGSVAAGSGFDASSGPGQAAETTGSTDAVSEPSPGVVIRSSGGALTSADHAAAGVDEQPVVVSAQGSSIVATTTSDQVESPATATAPLPTATLINAAEELVAAAIVGRSSAGVTPYGRRLVVPVLSEVVGPLTAPVRGDDRSGGAASGGTGPLVGRGSANGAIGVETLASRQPGAVPDEETSAQESLRNFTGVLAAALAPFVLPMPGSPVEAPTLWAVFAWARRQPAGSAVDDRPTSIADPRQTEDVLDTGGVDAPGPTIDRIDRATGRVTGHVNVVDVTDDERAGLTYALVKQVDRRQGIVIVNGSTGKWTFTPTPDARLAAHVLDDGGVVAFSIAASNGRTVDVRASVDPAEAVVTDTIDVGDGLTYGLAAVGDRLYVLRGSDDAAGNGVVKIFDTPTKTVVGSVEVGSMPYAMAVGGGSLYVGNADDGTVSVVDVESNTVVDLIDVGPNPFGLEVAGNRLYVADHAGTVSVIDLADNTELARIPVGGDPFALAATADRVYVTNYAGGTVAVLDQATHTALETAAAAADRDDDSGYPYFAAVTGGRLYVVNAATNALTIVDRSVTTAVDVEPSTRALDAIPDHAAPVDVVVRGDRLYVSNINCGTVAVIDVASNQPVANVGVGIQPGVMAATRDGRTVYVADVMGGTVRIITSVRHTAR